MAIKTVNWKSYLKSSGEPGPSVMSTISSFAASHLCSNGISKNLVPPTETRSRTNTLKAGTTVRCLSMLQAALIAQKIVAPKVGLEAKK